MSLLTFKKPGGGVVPLTSTVMLIDCWVAVVFLTESASHIGLPFCN